MAVEPQRFCNLGRDGIAVHCAFGSVWIFATGGSCAMLWVLNHPHG